MIIVLPFLLLLFFYAVFKSWQEKEDIYLIKARDDFDIKIQEIMIRKNHDGKENKLWKE